MERAVHRGGVCQRCVVHGLQRLVPRTPQVLRVIDRVFREYGLPRTIRTDNGPPFASVGLGGLTPLSIWWIKLGITPERIEPGHPEQNGRLERFHRTLNEETVSPPQPSQRSQQRAFDALWNGYNEQRPHEALKGEPLRRGVSRGPHSSVFGAGPTSVLATELRGTLNT